MMELTTEFLNSFQAEFGFTDRTIAAHLGIPLITYAHKRLGRRGFTATEAGKLRGLIGRIRYAQQHPEPLPSPPAPAITAPATACGICQMVRAGTAAYCPDHRAINPVAPPADPRPAA